MDWLSLIDPSTWLDTIVLQTPSTPRASSPEVELLKSQLEFLKSENARMATEFAQKLELVSQQGNDLNNSFKDYMNWALLIFGLFGSVFFFLFKQSLDDAREFAKRIVSQQVEQRVTEIVDVEIAKVQRLLDRERVVSHATLDYFLPNGQAHTEIQILKSRGFENIAQRTQLEDLRRSRADLVVVDLAHWQPDGSILFTDLPEPDREQKARELMQSVLDAVPDRTIVVAYVSGYVKSLNTFQQRSNPLILSNNRITLVGNLADAAYVARVG